MADYPVYYLLSHIVSKFIFVFVSSNVYSDMTIKFIEAKMILDQYDFQHVKKLVLCIYLWHCCFSILLLIFTVIIIVFVYRCTSYMPQKRS